MSPSSSPTPTWTREKIVATLRTIRAAGGALHHTGQKGHAITAAARQLFGSWDAALQAAGIDPGQVRLRKPWTRSEIVQTIRSRNEAGRPLNVKAAPRDLLEAACRVFDTWDRALEAAGLNPAAVRVRRRPWTAEEIVAEFQRKHRAGESLNLGHVRPFAIRKRARQLFGCWDNALEAAGIDPATVRRRRPPWTPETIIREIQRRNQTGEPLRGRQVNNNLRQPAVEFFGSWPAALRAAGLDPRRIGRRQA